MKSLVEVCAEQRARSWAEADDQREEREKRTANGRRIGLLLGNRGAGRKPSLTPEQEARAVRLYLEGTTVLEVAQEIRTTKDTIKSVLKRHGVKARRGKDQRAAAHAETRGGL